ncbi:MAG: ATP-binding protein [Candidatus Goldbacteria bacterium]|nr:ATP-binding protein [Candidatus Goldiibacteriota bacterium]
MIHSFSFKNFCSFAERADIHFDNQRKDLNNNMICSTANNEKLSKILMLAGANASGKTSVLKALAFIRWLIRDSFIVAAEEENSIPVDPFRFTDEREIPTEFETIFECNKTIYKYIVRLNQNQIFNEELQYLNDTNHYNYLFIRAWNADSKKFDFKHKPELGLNPDVILNILRKNVSLMSAGSAINNKLLIEISKYWDNMITNVIRLGKFTNRSVSDTDLKPATQKYDKDRALFKKVVGFLKEIDVGLVNVEIEKIQERNNSTGELYTLPFPMGVHESGNVNYKLPFLLESNGTKNMYVLMGSIFKALEIGGIAAIDEIELDLHPHAIPKIIDLFINPETNPKNSQLLFSSHSMDILNRLEKEQVILVEKDKNCKSSLYRLDSIKGIRRDDNLYAKYMSGAYGAVPNI